MACPRVIVRSPGGPEQTDDDAYCGVAEVCAATEENPLASFRAKLAAGTVVSPGVLGEPCSESERHRNAPELYLALTAGFQLDFGLAVRVRWRGVFSRWELGKGSLAARQGILSPLTASILQMSRSRQRGCWLFPPIAGTSCGHSGGGIAFPCLRSCQTAAASDHAAREAKSLPYLSKRGSY